MFSMVPVLISQGIKFLSCCSLSFHMVVQLFTAKAGGAIQDVGKEGERLLQGSSAQSGLTCPGPKSPTGALDKAAESALSSASLLLPQPASAAPYSGRLWTHPREAAMETLGKSGIHT